MTNREFFEAVKTIMTNEDAEIQFTAEEFVEHCDAELAKLDAKNDKARAKAAEKKAAGDELAERVIGVMSATDFEPREVILQKLDDEDVTINKLQYRLTQLEKDGRIEKTTVTVKGAKRMAYKLA